MARVGFQCSSWQAQHRRHSASVVEHRYARHRYVDDSRQVNRVPERTWQSLAREQRSLMRDFTAGTARFHLQRFWQPVQEKESADFLAPRREACQLGRSPSALARDRVAPDDAPGLWKL